MEKLLLVTLVFLVGFGIFVYMNGGGLFFLFFSGALTVAYLIKKSGRFS